MLEQIPIITIQEATPAHIDDIVRIHCAAEVSIYPRGEQSSAPGSPSAEEIEDYHFDTDFMARARTARERDIFHDRYKQLHVARLGEIIVGFSKYDAQTNWLDSLYIAPDYQGYGIGSRLLRRCLDAAGPEPTKLLTVDQSAAVDFYRKHGFTTGEGAPQNRRTPISDSKHIPLIGMVYMPAVTAA
jgi:ribosomal protein S18 acetylase RimI-like enzyme